MPPCLPVFTFIVKPALDVQSASNSQLSKKRQLVLTGRQREMTGGTARVKKKKYKCQKVMKQTDAI